MGPISRRRAALQHLGMGLAAGAAGLAAGRPMAAQAAANGASLLPEGAKTLGELASRLDRAPRRRDFKTVPMILNNPDQWDHEALSEVIAYHAGPKQVWDNTDIGSPWLNLMRNSLNAQIWSFRHPDFLAVSATHGSAHLALLDDAMWEKYGLAKLTGGKFSSNVLLKEKPAASSSVADYEKPDGVFSPDGDSIPVLQRRGVVFVACHNAIWEVTGKLLKDGVNPDKASHEAVAAELTNHLIPGAVLSPGVVGTLPELQMAGYVYAK